MFCQSNRQLIYKCVLYGVSFYVIFEYRNQLISVLQIIIRFFIDRFRRSESVGSTPVRQRTQEWISRMKDGKAKLSDACDDVSEITSTLRSLFKESGIKIDINRQVNKQGGIEPIEVDLETIISRALKDHKKDYDFMD